MNAQALGSLDGTAYVNYGDQLFRVGDDGSMTALGTRHETYTFWPRMSVTTGHVFFPYADRGTGETTVTVEDAHTGDVLTVISDLDAFHDSSANGVDPRDLPVIEGMLEEGYPAVLSPSPDGKSAIGAEEESDDHPRVAFVDEWSVGSTTPTLVRRIPFLIPNPHEDDSPVGSVVFETDDTFLIEASLPNWSGKGPFRSFVVRCTLEGACERVSKTTKQQVSIAGDGGVLVPGDFPYNN